MSASYIALSEKATKEGFDWLTWVRGASPSVLPVRWWAVIVLKSLVAPNLPTKMSVSVTCRIDLCSYRSQPDMCSQAPWAALTTWKTCGLTLLTLGRLRLCSSLHPLGVPSFWRDIRGNLLCWVTLPYMHLAWETNSAFVSRSLHGKQGPMASMPPPHKASAPSKGSLALYRSGRLKLGSLFGFLQLPECHEVFLAWTLLHLLRSGLVSKTCLPVALPATVRCFESLGDWELRRCSQESRRQLLFVLVRTVCSRTR